MTEAMETFTHAGITVEIHYDPDPVNPRTDYDHVGTFYLADNRNRYGFGDADAPESMTDADGYAVGCGSWADVLTAIGQDHGPVVVAVPVGLIDHSGVSVYPGGGTAVGDAAGWDSGTCGWMVAHRDAVVAAGWDPDTDTDAVRACLVAEIRELDAYLTGQVFGYVVDPDGIADSCWGFTDESDCAAEARAAAEWRARDVAARYASACAAIDGPDLAAAMAAVRVAASLVDAYPDVIDAGTVAA